MPTSIASDERFTRFATKIKAKMLPSTCKMYSLSSTTTDSGVSGSPTKAYVSYEGSTDIPCRVDDVPYVRIEDVAGQETQVNQYRIHIPNDLSIESDSRIEFDGRIFEIKKNESSSDWLPTSTAVIVEMRLKGVNVT